MEHENHMFRFRLNDFTEDLSYCFASAFLSLAVNRSSTGGDYDLVETLKKYFDLIYIKT